MNNIEILERLEQIQQTFREDGLQGYEMAIVTAKKLINNSIQENKELKEKQKEYEKQLDLDYVEENYIPKSKVKEIVELYDNTLQCTRKYNQDLADILCDLEELLEGE